MEQAELAENNNSDEKISLLSIDKHGESDNYGYATPPWVDSAKSILVKKSQKKFSIWDLAAKMLAHVPYNKIRKILGLRPHHFAFTCDECHDRGWPSVARSSLKISMSVRKNYFPSRCKTCNAKHARFKRANRAMQKIHDRGMDIWFITLTRPNITGVPGESPFVQEIDREQWVADFKRFRRTKIWKETFAGGYWFYEFTSHKPGDKIFAKDGTFIRQTQDHEINGHLHILATADGRIPMKELADQWEDRVDFRQPEEPNDVLRYLRGYLTKCKTVGINMRPFGDIHRSKDDMENNE